MAGYKEISDYGIIGNLSTSALVGRDGSIDWCCMPHLDSPSVFAAILDAAKGGRFRMGPAGRSQSRQRYIEETNVLETVFEAEAGQLTLVDFFPVAGKGDQPGDHPPYIFRNLRCTGGTVEVEIDLSPRFDYARAPARLVSENDLLICEGGGEKALLWTVPARAQWFVGDGVARGTATLRAGEELWLVLSHGREHRPSVDECRKALDRTVDFWRRWVHRCPAGCVFEGPWHDLAVRSALTLKLLTHPHTGAIAAAATTSLPESIGGARNWDYRFAWIRDASFAVQALHNLGHTAEAVGFLEWIHGIFRREGNPAALRVLYGLHEDSDVAERELDHLEGYRGSRPVRVGNAAANQRQLDIYGELMEVAYRASGYGKELGADAWSALRRLVDHVCRVWTQKGSGIWEVRGEPRHFTYSKAMCWVALDRGLRIAVERNWPCDRERWRRTAGEIRGAVLTQGYDPRRGSFVQSFGSSELDAANLLLPLVGFLPVDDPRVQGTIDATLRELTSSGLVRRYLGPDGLEGDEGAFLLCTFWLVDCPALSGRVEEAKDIFLDVIRRAGPLGLLPEELDPRTGGFLGNFPQAFSHTGLINSALYLGRALGKLQMGPEPLGIEAPPARGPG